MPERICSYRDYRSTELSRLVQTGLKEVMRMFPQGVTVVTTISEDGPKGITVSAFTSLSLDPPLVLVSLSRASAVHDIFTHAKKFAINFLADDQKSISDRFAGRHEVKRKFDGIDLEVGTTGSPLIPRARAVIECRTWRVYDAGDHSLLIGEVLRAVKLSDKPPLVYYAQQYTTMEPAECGGPQQETA